MYWKGNGRFYADSHKDILKCFSFIAEEGRPSISVSLFWGGGLPVIVTLESQGF